MAYTKTTWETGDTITAELLNHAEQGIYDASAKELPDVDGEDNGKVLTVAEGEWIAENLPTDKDVLVLEGKFIVDQSLQPQSFTLTSGDISEIANYKNAILKVTVSIGGLVDFAVVNVPYLAHKLYNPSTQQATDEYVFISNSLDMAYTSSTTTFAYIGLAYNAGNETWTYRFVNYTVTTN